MSAPLTDDLIARLKAHAAISEEQWDFSARDVLLEAAEALAAASREIEKVRADAHGDGQMHAIADVNAGLVDDLIAPRLASLRASAPPAAPLPWQPIETAPKDQTVLVVLKPYPLQAVGEITFAYFSTLTVEPLGVWTRDETGEAIVPTHWLPLPSPPASAPAAPAPPPEKSDGVRILQAMNRLPVRDETDSEPGTSR